MTDAAAENTTSPQEAQSGLEPSQQSRQAAPRNDDDAGGTEGSGGSDEPKVSWQDIKSVQNLIERCLQKFMTQTEIIAALQVEANVDPSFTCLVWQKLEQQNPDFFFSYHARLKMRDQIVAFNYLVDQQVYLINRVTTAGMVPHPAMPHHPGYPPPGVHAQGLSGRPDISGVKGAPNPPPMFAGPGGATPMTSHPIVPPANSYPRVPPPATNSPNAHVSQPQSRVASLGSNSGAIVPPASQEIIAGNRMSPVSVAAAAAADKAGLEPFASRTTAGSTGGDNVAMVDVAAAAEAAAAGAADIAAKGVTSQGAEWAGSTQGSTQGKVSAGGGNGGSNDVMDVDVGGDGGEYIDVFDS